MSVVVGLLRCFALICLFAPAMVWAGPQLLPAKAGLYHGAFLGSWQLPPKEAILELVDRYENTFGGPVQILTIHADMAEAVEDQQAQRLKPSFMFPTEAVMALSERGILPLVRMAPKSDYKRDRIGKDPIFNLVRIIRGDFDAMFDGFFRHIASLEHSNGDRVPLMMVFGPEVNGFWSRWNGDYYNQNSGWQSGRHSWDRYGNPDWPDGPEIFRDAYRHIIRKAREQGADNITFVFHFDTHGDAHRKGDYPKWNHPIYYYPGCDYVRWIGYSVWGPQRLEETSSRNFGYVPLKDQLKKKILGSKTAYEDLDQLISCPQPVHKAILEMGAIEKPRDPRMKATWIKEAYDYLKQNKSFKIVSYWHEEPWDKAGLEATKADSSPQSQKAFFESVCGFRNLAGECMDKTLRPAWNFSEGL